MNRPLHRRLLPSHLRCEPLAPQVHSSDAIPLERCCGLIELPAPGDHAGPGVSVVGERDVPQEGGEWGEESV